MMYERDKRAANKARNFPHNTCPASRHLQMIADALVSKRRKCPIEDCWDAEHLASTMYSVCASLWRARTQLRALDPAGWERQLEQAIKRALRPKAKGEG